MSTAGLTPAHRRSPGLTKCGRDVLDELIELLLAFGNRPAEVEVWDDELVDLGFGIAADHVANLFQAVGNRREAAPGARPLDDCRIVAYREKGLCGASDR